jgi:hypothetical protein
MLLAFLLPVSVAGCADDAAERQQLAAPSPTTSEPPAPTEEEAAARSAGDVCRLAASTIDTELRRWAGAEDVTAAPTAEGRLGPQPDDGVPGVLIDGCVWEVRGSAGGHIGVAVERFVGVDMTAVAIMARDAGVEPTESADGTRSWHVPPSGETPSGAVLVGDHEHLVVVRVESYSETDSGAPLGDDERAERFFRAVGDAVLDAHPD